MAISLNYKSKLNTLLLFVNIFCALVKIEVFAKSL